MTIQKSYLFNKKSYINLIKSFIKLGYEIKDFDSVIPTRRHLILRHDIDMSINAARDLAFLEKENSMKSTYFVLMNSEFYNVFAPDSIKLLNEIKSYGFKCYELKLNRNNTSILNVVKKPEKPPSFVIIDTGLSSSSTLP